MFFSSEVGTVFLSELRSFAMLKGWSGTNGDAIVRRGVYVNLGMLFSKRSIISMAACPCCGLDMTSWDAAVDIWWQPILGCFCALMRRWGGPKVRTFWSTRYWSCRWHSFISLFHVSKLLPSTCFGICMQLYMRKFDFSEDPHHLPYSNCPACWPRKVVIKVKTYFGI